ncbi:MAG: hypothetical protein HY654_03690 [Acidobacteria bacterium]|nr:hypothetical protein [Acidobacteriota bacterium]
MTRVLLLTATAAISAAIWVVLLPPATSIDHAIPFDHSRHTEVTCAACHRGAERSARAGIPEMTTCLKCHATAPQPDVVTSRFNPFAVEAKSTAAAKAEAPGPSSSAKSTWDELARGTQSPWAQVTRVPDHVMFSHRRHVTFARLDCASCHGDMRAQRVALGAAPMRLDMSACISCHKTEGATEDCLACHR